jgi:diguanylate cyclase (GGDEF)-like protein
VVEQGLVGGEGAQHLVQRCLPAGGGERVTELSVTTVRDDAARPLYRLVQLVDVTERHRAQARLQELADHDDLTGLLNARRFRAELDRQVAHSRRYGNPATLLLLDLDRFKPVNDRFGHAAGDALLRAVATALRGRLRETDHVGRLGGDEFAVLLPETPLDAARELAGDLAAAVARAGLVGTGDLAVQVSASIGAAPVGHDTADAGTVLAAADAAMYAAKRGELALAHAAPAGA